MILLDLVPSAFVTDGHAKTMRRSKRCVTGSSRLKKNTSASSVKKKKTETQSDISHDKQNEDESTRENIETIIEKKHCENTFDQSEEKSSEQRNNDVNLQIDSSGGRIGEDISQERAVKQGTNAMPDFFLQDEDGDTYLHIAVVQCNEGLVNYLIQAMKTTTLDIFNNLRQTPLHLAVITEQTNLIGQLIKAGCDVNAMDRNGQTPLHLACQRSDVGSAHAIFESASTNQRSIRLDVKNFKGLSPLHLATMTGNRELIGLIIDQGANINNKDTSSGRTPLHHAVEEGKYHVVEYFLARGASANATTYSGNTPLHTAAGRHMHEMIRLLSQHGADVNLANMEGDKPKVVQGSAQGQRQLEASRKRSKKTNNSKSTEQSTSKRSKS